MRRSTELVMNEQDDRTGDPRRFDEKRFSELRASAGFRLGDPLTIRRSTASTNDDAFEAAIAGAPHGAVFVAEEQTAGRGRRGHAWASPPFENLTFSLLLRPRVSADRVSALSLVAGLAVRRATARRVSTQVAVKWPNDVVVGKKKLCGILVESRVSGAAVQSVVVGAGVNVGTREFPAELRDIATSLTLLGAAEPGRETTLADVLAELDPLLETFFTKGLSPLLPELRENDALLGTPIGVGDVRGAGDGIDDDGSLLLRDDCGTVHRIASGTVARL
jgi:BirA family biotin operon repressor/biotin-[acetyl-CoA-carboxylase] ligase